MKYCMDKYWIELHEMLDIVEASSSSIYPIYDVLLVILYIKKVSHPIEKGGVLIGKSNLYLKGKLTLNIVVL